ncbi:MAG: type I-E CRISPR-associated protein Cse2/CasB, partial [Acidobacteriota bacterium]
ADVSEMRLERLLRTHDREMIWQVRGVVHQMRSSGVGCDLSELADLILADHHRNRSEAARRRDVIVRRKIADAYHRPEPKTETDIDSDD